MVKCLEKFETPANQCDAEDIYIKDQGDGTWNVAQWDGSESWDFGDDAIFTSREEAEAEAEEWLRQIQPSAGAPAPMEEIMKKTVREVVRGQCDECGLVGDRKKYTDGSSSKCPHCGEKTGYTPIR